jgi:hypothetical protein
VTEPQASRRARVKAIQRRAPEFQALPLPAAAAVARTVVKATPMPRNSFQYQGMSSRCACPPTWLQTVKKARSASRNSIARATRVRAMGNAFHLTASRWRRAGVGIFVVFFNGAVAICNASLTCSQLGGSRKIAA